MKKLLMNKKLWSVVILAVVLTLSISVGVFADDLAGFITGTLVTNLKTIAGAFVVLAAVATAILYMAGSVNPKLKDKGKDALYALIIGVIVLVLSDNIQGWIKGLAGK